MNHIDNFVCLVFFLTKVLEANDSFSSCSHFRFHREWSQLYSFVSSWNFGSIENPQPSYRCSMLIQQPRVPLCFSFCFVVDITLSLKISVQPLQFKFLLCVSWSYKASRKLFFLLMASQPNCVWHRFPYLPLQNCLTCRMPFIPWTQIHNPHSKGKIYFGFANDISFIVQWCLETEI